MSGADEPGLRRALAERGVDVAVPNVARIYDYLLGGKNHFQADRDAAEQIERQIPHSALACRQNREFLGRVVRSLAAVSGIRQFLDIGSGLPASGSVHEIAQSAAPDARVVYVDYDPMAVIHSQVLLTDKSRPARVAAVQADLRDPESITGNKRVRELIDFTQPVAVLLLAVLHFVPDHERPWDITAHFRDVMGFGSFLAVSHITAEGVSDAQSQAAQKVYSNASAPVVPRSRDQILGFFDRVEMVHPGLVDISDWPARSPAPEAPLTFYGGVARKLRLPRGPGAPVSCEPAHQPAARGWPAKARRHPARASRPLAGGRPGCIPHTWRGKAGRALCPRMSPSFSTRRASGCATCGRLSVPGCLSWHRDGTPP